jgi:hypothetical protein
VTMCPSGNGKSSSDKSPRSNSGKPDSSGDNTFDMFKAWAVCGGSAPTVLGASACATLAGTVVLSDRRDQDTSRLTLGACVVSTGAGNAGCATTTGDCEPDSTTAAAGLTDT